MVTSCVGTAFSNTLLNGRREGKTRKKTLDSEGSTKVYTKGIVIRILIS
jgi:hypothetical protein